MQINKYIYIHDENKETLFKVGRFINSINPLSNINWTFSYVPYYRFEYVGDNIAMYYNKEQYIFTKNSLEYSPFADYFRIIKKKIKVNDISNFEYSMDLIILDFKTKIIKENRQNEVKLLVDMILGV